MSEHDYPSEEELKAIATWAIQRTSDIEALLADVKNLWNWPDWGWHQKNNRLLISTGGWSGNEDLIDAMRENFIFWSLCFVSVRRGGHYEFAVPPLKQPEEPA